MDRIETETEIQADAGNHGPTIARINHVYRFGAFTLDEECSELRDRDHCISVQPKTLRLLAYLIRHHDRVVTRSELLDDLWDVASVVDGALTTAICEARRAIGDRHSVQWAIKTIPRRGYRFVADVEDTANRPASRAPNGADPHPDLAQEIARLESALRDARSRRGRRPYGARIV